MLNNKLEKVNIPTTEGSLNSVSTHERTLNEFEIYVVIKQNFL